MILKIVLLSLGGLVLLIIILLSLSATARVEYNGVFTVKVKYLFFTFYPTKERKKKKRKPKPEKPEKPKKKMSLDDIIAYYNNAKTPLKRLINKTRVTGFNLVSVIGGDDAATIALTYGLQSAAINGFVAWLKETVILDIKKVSVTADFTKEESETRFKCKVKIRVFTALMCLIQYVNSSAKNKS